VTVSLASPESLRTGVSPAGPERDDVNEYDVAFLADAARVTSPPAPGRNDGDAVRDEMAGKRGGGARTAPGETKIHFSPLFQTSEAHEASEMLLFCSTVMGTPPPPKSPLTRSTVPLECTPTTIPTWSAQLPDGADSHGG
jgi:hypothetical protein